MNLFSDLYVPHGCGDWMTPRQGLSAGMDLHDWKQFIVRAISVIRLDEDAERRIFKAQRLMAKARKVAGCWGAEYFLWRIGNVIHEAQDEISNRANVRLVQLSYFTEAQQ